MFDIHNSQLHVLDPVHCPERARLHNFFKTTFLKALAGCFEAFYDNWSLSAADCWQFHYPQLCPQNISRYKLPPPHPPQFTLYVIEEFALYSPQFILMFYLQQE